MNHRSAVAAPSLLVGSVFGVLHTEVELLNLVNDLPWHQPEGKRLKVKCPGPSMVGGYTVGTLRFQH